jgi:hypothetical protein
MIVKACLSVSVKLGLSVMLAIFASIDAVIHLLLANLEVCVAGIVGLVANL